MSDVIPDEKRLTPEFKAKWLEALRSGTYHQGEGRLRDFENSFCCLGVALDLLGTSWSKHNEVCYETPAHSWGYLNDQEMAAIGITAEQHRKLAEMNDDGEKFRAIADWIEKNL